MKKNLRKILALTTALALALVIVPAGLSSKAYADEDDYYAHEIVSNATSLAKVTGLSTLQRSDDEIALTWAGVDGASGYEICRYSSASGNWLLEGRSGLNSFESDDLRSGSTYTFKVRAYAKNASGTIVYGEYSNSFKTCTSPDDVEYLQVSGKTSTSITLSWSAVSRADRYQVYKYNSNSGKWSRVITTSKTTYKVRGLDSGKTYKFKVRAYRSALGYKYYSDYEYISAKTSGTSASAQSGVIGLSKAKSIALERAGISSSNATFTSAHLDYDDGLKIYEIDFYSGNYEYDVEINAYTGDILDYERDSVWD